MGAQEITLSPSSTERSNAGQCSCRCQKGWKRPRQRSHQRSPREQGPMLGDGSWCHFWAGLQRSLGPALQKAMSLLLLLFGNCPSAAERKLRSPHTTPKSTTKLVPFSIFPWPASTAAPQVASCHSQSFCYNTDEMP